ncbi:MAG: radical SAM protein [Bacteroidota bacterium]|nr:radical SAM protein [Bacteroidota bacterium]MDE2833704.1 radical SAM protein [Bacteroidota bacterium]
MTYRPSLVSWNLTRKCNLRCPHCYLSAGKAADRELSTSECLGLLDELHALGTEMLILTGGEPLLRRDIYEIALKASGLGLWVVMGTNGVLVTPRVARRMVECGVKGVGISIDSIDPDRHNRFRGSPKAWQHSVRALEICKAEGLEVLVQTTVMKENYDEIPALLDFAREHGAWAFNLYFLVQTGRGKTMTELTPDATDAMLTRLVDAQTSYRPMLVRSKCAPQFKQIAYARGRGGMESGGCMAATEYCRITPEGDVTPCPYMDVVAGSVLETSFTTIWQDSDVFAALRDPDRLSGRCGACEFKALCGGCRCRAFARFGDYLSEDPACTYQPTGASLAEHNITWDQAARTRLDRIPISFIRNKTRRGVEAYARSIGSGFVTTGIMSQALSGMERAAPFKQPQVPAPTTPVEHLI